MAELKIRFKPSADLTIFYQSFFSGQGNKICGRFTHLGFNVVQIGWEQLLIFFRFFSHRAFPFWGRVG